jgi:hypothetical protein
MSSTKELSRKTCLRSKLIKEKERTMGAMRMGNKHLSDTIQVCNWVIENTDSLHSKNIMARGLVNRIHKFIHQTGRDKVVSNHIKQDTETAVLFND